MLQPLPLRFRGSASPSPYRTVPSRFAAGVFDAPGISDNSGTMKVKGGAGGVRNNGAQTNLAPYDLSHPAGARFVGQFILAKLLFHNSALGILPLWQLKTWLSQYYH